MIQIVLEYEPDDFWKQPVIAIDNLDEFTMALQALQRERITVNCIPFREPGDRTLKPLQGGFELAGIIGIPRQSLRALAGLCFQRNLRVAGEARGLDEWRHLPGEVGFENIDKQNHIVRELLTRG